MKIRYKATTILIASLIAIMLLAGLAIAASRSGILDTLFDGGIPNEKAENMIDTGNFFKERDGIRLSVEETLFDISALAVTFKIESALNEPVLIDLDRFCPSITIDGELASPRMVTSGLRLLSDPLNGIDLEKTYAFTNIYALPEGKEGARADIEASVFAYKPLVPVMPDRFARVPDENGQMARIETADALYFLHDGYINPYDYEIIYARMEMFYAQHGEDDWDSISYGANDAMTDAGMIADYTDIHLEFSLMPDTAFQSFGTRIRGQNVFEFEDYTLVITKMNFTATATEIEYEIHPKTELPPRDWDEEPHAIERWYAPIDENGDDIRYNTSGSGGGAGGRKIGEDGKEYLSYGYSYGPARSIPQRITMVPINNYEQKWVGDDLEGYYDEERSHFAWDEAVSVELK